ncbi:MAG: hypothetical protein Q4D02_00425 [Clostridia bacterium]|nr:hypothetical protein [Clostridia bacterium]
MQHHEFKKGKKIHIILKDGNILIGKFKEKKSKSLIITNDNGEDIRVNFANIRSSTIFNPSMKNKEHRQI